MTFLFYGIDKYTAKKGSRRVPEKTLHILSLLGGSPFAFIAQRLFHHKTRQKPFQVIFCLTVCLQIILIYIVMN